MSLGRSITAAPPLAGEARLVIGNAPFTYYRGWYWLPIVWTDFHGRTRRFLVITNHDRTVTR